MSPTTVVVEDLHVAFGSTWALDGVDLDVPRGTTLGVLGHNGAGKTTLVRVLATLVRPTVGRVAIDGFDIGVAGDEVRRRIGLTGQYAGLDEFLTGRENLELIGRLTGLGRRTRARADELIDRLDLGDLAGRRVGGLSGGSRRRIDLAASLVGSPSVLVLDEPTTGLDPTARTALWDVVGELTATGTTVVLTTQYLEEADRLADRIVVLDHGRIAAQGAPAELKRLVGGKVVTATMAVEALDLVPARPERIQPVGDGQLTATFGVSSADAAARLLAELVAAGVTTTDLDVASPSLDDVFTHLVLQGAES
jgi:ABC-2 type transport system ATP-binding protein